MQKAALRIAKIKLLPEYLINQIAAGEVIERPASVVKELLDNSLDAHASQVVIDIERGGVGLIRVKDDGLGIQQQDLELALTRHATSKIQRLEDLQKLSTMGFRGEALPSIASISRLSIMSGLKEDEHAWMIKSEGRSDHSSVEPAAHSQGTTIEVRDLFFNVPARRKYLRTERTEFYQIQQLVRHFAISHPELAVRLSHNGRQILNLKYASGDDGAKRVHGVYGARFMQHAIRVASQERALRISGWIGKAEAARTMNDSQFFCLNGRCIRDKRVNHAIQQAYQGILPEGRYATYALHLEMDPAMVDVNVHPSKIEVRFREGRSVHDFIYSALHQALNEQERDILTDAAETSLPSRRFTQSPRSPSISPYRPGSVREMPRIYRSDPSSIKQLQKTEGELKQIGNVLLIKNVDTLVLVDINKAMEELCRIKLQTELETGQLRSKPLLFPRCLKIDEMSAQLIRTHSELLQCSGVIISDNEAGSWSLKQLPAAILTQDPDGFVTELLEVLQQQEHELKSLLLEMMVCHHVRNNSVPKQEEILSNMNILEQKGIARKLSVEELMSIIHE